MNKKQLQSSLILILTAFIWGFAFAFQREGMDHIGPFTFNWGRFMLGSLSLLPVIYVLGRIDKKNRGGDPEDLEMKSKKNAATLKAGLICGTALFVGASTQQFGLQYTDAGKAGFITALYMVLVPIFSIVLKKKVHINAWIGVVIAAFGLYLLCIKAGGNFAMATGDLIILIGSTVWAIHILVVDHFVAHINVPKMSAIQFATCSALSLLLALFTELPQMGNGTVQIISALGFGLKDAIIPLFFTGIVSCGLAYTLQIVGQKNSAPTVASIILSMESVFAVIGGVLLLNEVLTFRESMGCVFVLVAVIVAQIPFPMRKKVHPQTSSTE